MTVQEARKKANELIVAMANAGGTLCANDFKPELNDLTSAARAEGYAEGAETMRERAAQKALKWRIPYWDVGPGAVSLGETIAKEIRALPVNE